MTRTIRIRRDPESFFGGALWVAVCPDGRDVSPERCTYTIHNTHREAVAWASDHLQECHV